MKYMSIFISEDFTDDTITVSVPGLGIRITGMKVNRPKGIDYAMNEFSTFDVEISDDVLKKIKDGNLKTISASLYNITGNEHRQPTQRIDAKVLKPVLQLGQGIGETFILEMTKCADNLVDYFSGFAKQAEAAAGKIPGAKNLVKEQPSEILRKKLQSAIRLSAGGVTRDSFGSQSAIQKPVVTIGDSDDATVHGGAGTGFHTDKRGSAVQGQMTLSESNTKSPMSVLGIDSIRFPGMDILPKGNVLTPHISKLPDILGYISLGIGVMNIFNVIRELWNIEEKWMKDGDAGFKKVTDGAFDLLKEINNRVNAGIEERAAQARSTHKSTTERIMDLTSKIREEIEKEKQKQAEKERAEQAAKAKVQAAAIAQMEKLGLLPKKPTG